ncbi:hypothetical protein [Prauserella cavernicola]|uniref:Uncharacterized protein n=1 Tax=Prauserella cavernicola TaxID=2800127 RepID=A0A934V659_9PSEU|nr:hypothetical protein [Prauserella cavernicola]MBK1787197.1 hypothetical protein [Prauserella cavernicola]
MTIQHADWMTYVAEVQTALDEFGTALSDRYEQDLDDHKSVWTPADPKVPDPSWGHNGHPWEDVKPQIPEWVSEILASVTSAIPVYENQDLNALDTASEQLKGIASTLGYAPGTLGDHGRVPDLMEEINNAGGEWKGVSADTFGENFGKSVDPTMENQRDIAASLARLYSARAAINSATRGHVLSTIRQATESLGGTVASGAETGRWTFVSVVSVAVGFANAPLGAFLSVAAIIGSVVDPLDPAQKSAHDIGSVVTAVLEGLGNGKTKAEENELAYSNLVTALQDAITGKASTELELYDFTSGEGVGEAETGAYEVVRGTIERLAASCFAASEEYEHVIKAAIATDDADPHLKGINNTEQSGDVKLKDTRDTFVGFLQTTCARYREAGDRLMDAAREYDNSETTNADILNAIHKELDFNGDHAGTGGTVEQHIGATPAIARHWPS